MLKKYICVLMIFVLITTAVLYLSCTDVNADVQNTYYISPNGNDTTGDGSLLNPWATINKARDYIRNNNLNDNMTGDIEVCLASGDYFVNSTIQFTDQDSGSNGYKVIYKNKDGLGSARIIGGAEITNWTLDSGSVYKAYVGVSWVFHTMTEDGIRAYKARYPNRDDDPVWPVSKKPYLYSDTGGSTTTMKYKSGDLNPNGWDISDAELCVWDGGSSDDHPHDVSMGIHPVSSINTSTRVITTSTTMQYGCNISGCRYFIQGVPQLLDEAGEFYLDESTGYVYYWPRNGNPNNSEILAPKLTNVVSLIGADGDTRIHDITFEGLILEMSDFSDYYNRFDYATCGILSKGLLYMEHTQYITIKNCHFKNSGYDAIHLEKYNTDNLISGCWIEHSGGSGIGNRWWGSTSEEFSYYGSLEYIKSNTITNCRINNPLELKGYGGGIQLHGSLNYNEISHCEVYDSPDYGIDFAGVACHFENNTQFDCEENIYKYCYVYYTCEDRSDASGMNMCHMGYNDTNNKHINYYQNCVIEDARKHSSILNIFGSWGMRLDAHCSFIDVKNVYIDDCSATVGDFLPAFNQTWDGMTATLTNVNFTGTDMFDPNLMEYKYIGLKSDFPQEWGPSYYNDDYPGITYSGTWSESNNRGYGDYRDDVRYTSTNNDYVEFEFIGSGIGWITGRCDGLAAAEVYIDDELQVTVNTDNDGSREIKVEAYSNTDLTSGVHKIKIKKISGGDLLIDGFKIYRDGSLSPTPSPIPTPVPSPTPALIIPADGEGHWKLNETSGTTASDSSGNGRTGTAYGSAVWNSNGRVKGCLEFDGTNDYVEVADNSNLDVGTSDFAISLWFYRHENAATNLRVLSKGADSGSQSGYAILGSDSGIYARLCNGTDIVSLYGDHSGTNEWTHLVVNFNRDGYMHMYINGIFVAGIDISSMSGINIDSSYPLRIGRATSSILYWDGLVDEIRVFKRLLTSSEIAALNNEAPPVDAEGHWKFNETIGTTASDSSGNVRTGTVYGSAVWNSSGQVNGCLEYDGTNDYVEVTDNSNLDVGTSDFAISLWFNRHENATTNLRVLSKGAENGSQSGYCIFGSDSSISARLCDGTNVITSSGVNHGGINAWTHMVVNFDRDGNMSIYINGTCATTADISSMSGSNIDSSYPLRIGRSTSSAFYWDGLVDEVRVFKRLLTSSEIAALNNEAPPADAKGHWKLNETSGTTASDSSGNGRTGTVYGSAVWNSSGRMNGCLEFDGTNDYVEVSDNNNLDVGTSDFAISLWFYRHENAATNLRVLSKGAENGSQSGYCIFGSDSSISARICDGTNVVDSSGVNPGGINAWTHMVVNFDRDGNMSIYINGTCATTADISSMSGSNIDSSYPLRIGRSTSSAFYWDGLVDEVRVFKRLLTYNEIMSLCNE